MSDPLYWIAFNCIGVANKVARDCMLGLAICFFSFSPLYSQVAEKNCVTEDCWCVCLVKGPETELDDSLSPLCSSTDVYLLAEKEHIGLGCLRLITAHFVSVSYESPPQIGSGKHYHSNSHQV